MKTIWKEPTQISNYSNIHTTSQTMEQTLAGPNNPQNTDHFNPEYNGEGGQEKKTLSI